MNRWHVERDAGVCQEERSDLCNTAAKREVNESIRVREIQ